MDPLSHAVVGGTLTALRIKDTSKLRLAIYCGMSAALVPDLDVFIRSASDPLLNLQYHRHFTHSLIFTPIGAACVAFLWWLLLRRKEPFKRLWGYCFLGIFSHGILDSMTNYGTHLFWPFLDQRESWSIISIIDPIFTLTLLVLLMATLIKRTRKFVCVGALFACVYLTFGVVQKERATHAMVALATERLHSVARYEVKPAFGNLLVWRTQYAIKNHYVVDAFRVAPSGAIKHYQGGEIEAYAPNPETVVPLSQMEKDIERFRFFSDGWLATLPEEKNVIGDMRFGLLPTDTRPLWGIRIDPKNPESHAAFVNLRQRREGDLQTLWAMILGEQSLKKY